MFRVRRRSRTARAATMPPAENALRGAEEIVRRAWARELLRRRERAQFDLRAATDDEDAARERLASAQRDGEPWMIAAAHAALERAIEASRASTRACDRTRRTLRTELELLEQATRDRALSDLVRQMEHERTAFAGERLAASGAKVAASGSRLRLPRVLRRLTVRRTAQLERP